MEYEEIVKENEEYLNIFKEYLKEKGLNETTIENHYWHVDYYINHFLMLGIPKRMADGCSIGVTGFIENYVNEKVIPASKNNVNKFSSSILKFYKCMLEKGFVSKENYDDLAWAIKECKDEMIDDYYRKNPEVIDLNKIIDCIEAAGDIETFYLNKNSGEIMSVPQDGSFLDDEITEEMYWKIDMGFWLQIPGQYELHEYNIMESFAESLSNEQYKDKLLYELNCKKPFRRFKDEINYLGIANDYYSYRREKIKKIAIRWLQDNKLEYKE